MQQINGFLFLVAVLSVSAAAWPAGQGRAGGAGQAAPPLPGQAAPAPLVGTGFISGQVVDVPGGKGISEVGVAMISQTPGAFRTFQVVTDSQGRFFFANLPPGKYQLSTNKSGYVAARASSPTVVELADGERVTNTMARLMKVGSLSGTLRDESGDPVVGTDVLVMMRTVTSGRQALMGQTGSRSDDRGQYRFGNLPPGDYVVCACKRSDFIPFDATLLTTLGSEPLQLMTVAARALTVGADVVSLDTTLRTYPPTLHPNAVTFARAAKVTLAPGEDKLAVDINLPLVKSVRVSGTITGALGPVQAGSMRLMPSAEGEVSADLFSLPPFLVQADGRFDFAMVPPGLYRLIVVHRETDARAGGPSGLAMGFVGARGATPPPAGATAGNAAPGQPVTYLWANEAIAVGENGVTGLVVALNRAPVISGRVQWIGAAPVPPPQMLQRVNVLLQPAVFTDPLVTQLRSATGRLSPEATFTTSGTVPGKWMISATPLPGYPTLKSVTVGGLDITDMALEIGEKDIADVVITYVDTPMASLTVVSGPAPSGPPPADDPSILVFPADRKFWTEPAAAGRRFRSWVISAGGTTTTPDLPGGEYFVLRAGTLDVLDWMEASKLEALSRRAQRVTVPETGTSRIEVRR